MKRGLILVLILLSVTITLSSAIIIYDEPTYIKKAVAERDLSICGNIETANVREFCINRVHYVLGIENSDISECKLITEKVARENCINDLFQTD